jgi:hypothetical protein
MTFPAKTLAALLVTASVPLFAGQAGAAPIGQSVGLSNAQTSNVEQVQWRRWRRGHWVGPAAGFAAGVAVGSAFAGPRYYDDGYYAYGAAPGFYRGDPCVGDENYNSGFASWQCRPFPRATDRNRW